MIDDFLHVSITCRDLERSIRFYETLGLKTVKRFGEVDEDGIGRAFGLPKGRLAVAYLAASDAAGKMFIDLVQWLEPEPAGEAYSVPNNVGLNRMAFRVPNLDAAVPALREQGIAFLSPEPEIFGERIRCIVTKDPDGVFVQLIEGL